MEDVTQIVYETIRKVADEKDIKLNGIQNSYNLIRDVGFKSIDLARLIAVLELKLKVDPFSKLIPITSIQTVGDLCNAYIACFSKTAEVISLSDFNQSEKRGEMRLNSSINKRGDLRRMARMG
ncbi:MAG: hypothetical protein HQK79_06085 [Desulfobacterales bacterium]|nr:hypothetical protein [Desulfobacterales bacterium]MBF0397284.1 hypothetical protein [Desulfobacterales bacterium]